MSKFKLLASIIIVLCTILSFTAFAADTSEGQRLGKPCAGCHSTDGYAVGDSVARIGGQNTEYISKVMTNFAAGKRPASVEMTIVAKGYTPEGLKAISEYYGSKKFMASKTGITKAKKAEGKKLADDNGCFGCHGDKGLGSAETPRIAGQNKGYMSDALKSYKAGQIQSDEMAFVKDMDEKQLDVLAVYFSAMK